MDENTKLSEDQNEARPNASEGAHDRLLGDERIVRLIKYLTDRILEEKQWRLEDSTEAGGDEVKDSLDREKSCLCTQIKYFLQIKDGERIDKKIYDSFFT